jgi:hypothetical protein
MGLRQAVVSKIANQEWSFTAGHLPSVRDRPHEHRTEADPPIS